MYYKKIVRLLTKNILVRNGVYGIFEIGVPFVLIFFTTPFLINRMGTESYGLWNIALAFLGMMGVLDFGVSTAVIKYISEYYTMGNLKSLSATVSAAFGINIIVGLVFGAIFYFFSGPLVLFFPTTDFSISQMELILKAASLAFFPVMVRNVALAIPRGFQDYRTPSIILITQNVFTLASAVLIVYWGGSVLQVMISTVIISWLVSLVSFYLGWRRLFAIGVRPEFNLQPIKKIFRFILFMGLTGVGITIFSFLDRIVVGQMLGLTAVTYYTIATGIANKFSALASALTRALLPAFSSWGVKNDAKGLKIKYLKATITITIIIFLPGMLFLYLSRYIVFFWLGEKNGAAILPVLQILVFIYASRGIASPAFQALNGLNYPHITTFTALTAGIGTITLIYLLAPQYGLVGAAWANIASWISFYTIGFLLIKLEKQES